MFLIFLKKEMQRNTLGDILYTRNKEENHEKGRERERERQRAMRVFKVRRKCRRRRQALPLERNNARCAPSEFRSRYDSSVPCSTFRAVLASLVRERANE